MYLIEVICLVPYILLSCHVGPVSSLLYSQRNNTLDHYHITLTDFYWQRKFYLKNAQFSPANHIFSFNDETRCHCCIRIKATISGAGKQIQ